MLLVPRHEKGTKGQFQQISFAMFDKDKHATSTLEWCPACEHASDKKIMYKMHSSQGGRRHENAASSKDGSVHTIALSNLIKYQFEEGNAKG